jgi:hypothetical protein
MTDLAIWQCIPDWHIVHSAIGTGRPAAAHPPLTTEEAIMTSLPRTDLTSSAPDWLSPNRSSGTR